MFVAFPFGKPVSTFPGNALIGVACALRLFGGLRQLGATQGLVVTDARFPAPDGFRLVSSQVVCDGEGTPVRIVHPDAGLRLTFAPHSAMPRGWYQFELKFSSEGLVDVVVQFAFAQDVLWLRMPAIARNHFVAQFRLAHAVQELTLIVTGSGRLTEPLLCRFSRVGLAGRITSAARRGVEIF